MWVLKTTPCVGTAKQGQNPEKCHAPPGRDGGCSHGQGAPVPLMCCFQLGTKAPW